MNNEPTEIISPIEGKAYLLDGVLAVLHHVSDKLGGAPTGNIADSIGLYAYFASSAKGLASMTDLVIDEIEHIKATIEAAINNAYKGA